MTLDITALETWLWEAACRIRGPVDAPKYKDYILPLVFLKRLSDVFDDEAARLGEEFADENLARDLVEDDHALVRFYVPRVGRSQGSAHFGRGGVGRMSVVGHLQCAPLPTRSPHAEGGDARRVRHARAGHALTARESIAMTPLFLEFFSRMDLSALRRSLCLTT